MRPMGVAGGSARPAPRAALRGVVALLSAVALLGVAGCSGMAKPEVVPSDWNVEAAVTVRVIDNEYVPAEVEIQVGEAVRWVFEGPMDHDVVAADGSFVTELTRQGDYTHVFDSVGEFAYDCSVHPEMTGVVRVTQ